MVDNHIKIYQNFKKIDFTKKEIILLFNANK